MNEYKVRVYANDGTVQNTLVFGRPKFSDELEEAQQISKYQIHKDDTIAQIKTKILNELKSIKKGLDNIINDTNDISVIKKSI